MFSEVFMILLSYLKLHVFQEKCCLDFFKEVRDFDKIEQRDMPRRFLKTVINFDSRCCEILLQYTSLGST